jgi:hypothetical protein
LCLSKPIGQKPQGGDSAEIQDQKALNLPGRRQPREDSDNQAANQNQTVLAPDAEFRQPANLGRQDLLIYGRKRRAIGTLDNGFGRGCGAGAQHGCS